MAPASVTHRLLKTIFSGSCRRVSWLHVAVVGDWTLSFLDTEDVGLNTTISIQEKMVPRWHRYCWQDQAPRAAGPAQRQQGSSQADPTASDSGISHCPRLQISPSSQPLLISPTCDSELQVCCQSVQRGGSLHISIWLWTSFPIS